MEFRGVTNTVGNSGRQFNASSAETQEAGHAPRQSGPAPLAATLALAVAAAEWTLVKALADALASGPAPAEEPLADALLLAAEAGRWDVARGLAPLVAEQLAKTRAPADPPFAGVVDLEAERRKRQ